MTVLKPRSRARSSIVYCRRWVLPMLAHPLEGRLANIDIGGAIQILRGDFFFIIASVVYGSPENYACSLASDPCDSGANDCVAHPRRDHRVVWLRSFTPRITLSCHNYRTHNVWSVPHVAKPVTMQEMSQNLKRGDGFTSMLACQIYLRMYRHALPCEVDWCQQRGLLPPERLTRHALKCWLIGAKAAWARKPQQTFETRTAAAAPGAVTGWDWCQENSTQTRKMGQGGGLAANPTR